jgi:hypothetical protein
MKLNARRSTRMNDGSTGPDLHKEKNEAGPEGPASWNVSGTSLLDD